jgi:hypothetical protein
MIIQSKRGLHFRPDTASGWLALALGLLSIVLFAARTLLTPALNLPPGPLGGLSYLYVMVALAAAGVVAAYSVALRRERSLSVMAALFFGLIACLILVLETIHPSAG